MKLRRLVDIVGRGQDAIIRPLGWVGCVLIYMMVALVTVHVFGRFLLGKPILGVIELVELAMVIIAFFAIPYTAMMRGHVRVDVVTSRLPRHIQAILGSITLFLSAGIWGVLTYRAIVNAITYVQHLERVTTVLFITLAPFRCVMALGCLLIALKLLAQVFHPLSPGEGGGPTK